MKLEKLGPVGPEEFRGAGALLVPSAANVLLLLRTSCRKETNQVHSSSASSNRFLCFGGRFRLSGMTRVTPGAIPDFRATRRASVPLSKIFFRFRFITPLFRRQSPNARI